MLVETDADEVNDIGVVEFGHDQRFHQEIHFGLIGRQLGQRLVQNGKRLPEKKTTSSH